MEQGYGYFLYVLSLLTMGGIYAILCLGLNIQWGFTGLFNAGVAGFIAVGAYVSAFLTTAESARHLGGFDVPLWIGAIAAMIASAGIAWCIGKICVRLRTDYLAIATIGIAEIIRLAAKNEVWATNGPRGVSKIPKAFETLPEPWNQIAFMGMVLGSVVVIYLLLERARVAPWGRVMTAIRENEEAAMAAGKNVERFRLESFVLGASLMGLAGAYLAQDLKFFDPNTTDPLTATFLVWVMLIIGGSANNRGAILGAMLMWTVWSATEIVTSRLPDALAIRSAYLRVFLIGLVLQIVLQKYPQGIIPEKRPARRGRSEPTGLESG
ncbi:MAG: branched-chain amino acid ABC transporter permease [Gammaproteobacteria bacterium]